MSVFVTDAALRGRRLRALGVEPWRLRHDDAGTGRATASADVTTPAGVTPMAAGTIRRLALQPDPAELRDPAVNRMYVALTEAVGKAGLQAVRVCDVAGDANAAVMVFGAAPLPEGVPAVRVLRADPLELLHADRDRKRLLWEQMLALGRAGSR